MNYEPRIIRSPSIREAPLQKACIASFRPPSDNATNMEPCEMIMSPTVFGLEPLIFGLVRIRLEPPILGLVRI